MRSVRASLVKVVEVFAKFLSTGLRKTCNAFATGERYQYHAGCDNRECRAGAPPEERYWLKYFPA